MNWITPIESDVSIIHFSTIHFTGIAGITILTIMDILPGIIRDFQWPGIGAIHHTIAGTHPTHAGDGDGDIPLITVTGATPITEAGVIIIRGMDTVVVITEITGMLIRITTVMGNAGQQEQILSVMITVEEGILQVSQQIRLPATKVVQLGQMEELLLRHQTDGTTQHQA